MIGRPQPLITLFAAPKPFKGAPAKAQQNAIQSWVDLGPDCKVILVGDDYGIAEAGLRYGVVHLPQVERSEFGTPLVNDTFRMAEEASSSPLLCYLNADIILTSDFLRAVQSISIPRFLMVGRRWNIDPVYVPDLSTPDWERQLRQQVRMHGRLYTANAIDYFVYTRHLWPSLPPLTIGRAGWDNYMIYRARVLDVPVIDATRVIQAVHQNHDYSHHPDGVTGVWTGEEATRNRELAGGYRYIFSIADATWSLTQRGLKRPPLTTSGVLRSLEALPILRSYLTIPCGLARFGLLAMRKVATPILKRAR